MNKVKALFKRTIPYLSAIGAGFVGLFASATAHAQTFDLTPNASTTAAVAPIGDIIETYAGQALAFVIAVFGQMWYCFSEVYHPYYPRRRSCRIGTQS